MSKERYHVHVYKVPEKAEVDVHAKSEEDAMARALRMAIDNRLVFKKNDEGSVMSMAFGIKERDETP